MKDKIHIASCSFGKEEWRDIEAHPGYQVSNLGRVKSVQRLVRTIRKGKEFSSVQQEKLLSLQFNKSGYLVVSIGNKNSRKTHSVSRLVATAFLPNPSNLPEVNHKNENKRDNSASNLEWCTREYNQSYGTRRYRISETMMQRDAYKHVLQYDLDGNFIADHISISAAERSMRGITGKCGENIRQNILGNTKHAYGYIWRYEET